MALFYRESARDVYVVGDVAAFRGPADCRLLPMRAEFAIREAAHAAYNILQEAHGEPAVAFEPTGMASSSASDRVGA